ncbi:MAG: M23 family metallopeptidase [Candidatus Kryptoniota bacterium]
MLGLKLTKSAFQIIAIVLLGLITFPVCGTVCHGGSRSSSSVLRTGSSEDTYLFPTDASRQINSGFADYRLSHFHGGIDISTNGEIGYPVFAAKSGYVYRVSVSPFGYGKMIVLRHNDSSYTLYGHLSEFSKEIERRVGEAQREENKYGIDLRFKPDEIKVDRGEVIAFTGATGDGSPHLHFEVHDKNYFMVDPLVYGTLDVPNYRTPRIFNVAVRGFTSENTKISKVVKSGGKYYAKQTFHLNEPFYFVIHAADAYGSGKFKRPPKYVSLKIDGKDFISLNLTRIDEDDYLDVGSLVDLSLSRRLKTYYMLCVDRAIPFSVFSPSNPLSGLVDQNIQNGAHNYEIVVEDENGNHASVFGEFVLNISGTQKNSSVADPTIEPFKEKVSSLSPDLTIEFPANCFTKNIDVEARMISRNSFEISSLEEPLRKKVNVTWKVDDPKLRLFRKTRNRWSYVDCSNDGKELTAKIGYRTGEFALLRDDTPPVIGRIRFARKNPFYRSVIPTNLNKAFVYFKVSDKLSGVNTDEILLRVGDEAFLCEYDCDKHAAICQVDVSLLRQKKKVEVVVQDNAGNEKVSQTRFR